MTARLKISFIVLCSFFCVVISSEIYASTGRENFLYYCAQCHGATGDGKGPNALRTLPVDPRDFTDPSALGILTDDEIVDIIENGGRAPSHSTLMPPYKMTLTIKEITELKDFLRTLYIPGTR